MPVEPSVKVTSTCVPPTGLSALLALTERMSGRNASWWLAAPSAISIGRARCIASPTWISRAPSAGSSVIVDPYFVAAASSLRFSAAQGAALRIELEVRVAQQIVELTPGHIRREVEADDVKCRRILSSPRRDADARSHAVVSVAVRTRRPRYAARDE